MIRLVDYIDSLPINQTNNTIDISDILNKKVYDIIYSRFFILKGIENRRVLCYKRNDPNNTFRYSPYRLYLINNDVQFEEIIN